MKKMFVLCGTIVFAFLTLGVSSAQNQPKAMTNADVVAMVKAQLPDDTIVDAIGLQETNFDGSALALVDLKKEGVSSKVMDAMIAVLKKRRDSDSASPKGANQFTSAPTATTTGQTTGEKVSPPSKPAAPASSTAPAAGVFNAFGQLQGQVNTAVQEVQGTVQQTKGAPQQPKQGTPQTQQGKQSSAPASPTSTTTPRQANAVQPQQTQPQQAVDPQKLNEKLAACLQPVTQAAQAKAANDKAHPEDRTDAAKISAFRTQQAQLQKDYVACLQRARQGQ